MERIIHALVFELKTESFDCTVCIWPADRNSFRRFLGRRKKLYTARAGEMFRLRGETRIIKRVTLYRVHPADENDREVPCAQDWLDGLV